MSDVMGLQEIVRGAFACTGSDEDTPRSVDNTMQGMCFMRNVGT